MAKYSNGPQKEDGYTPIANEILEALTLGKFTTREYKCLLFLLRKTYGWSKKEDGISLTQWVDGTGLYKIDVSRTLKRLEERHIIVCEAAGLGRGASKIYGFNKHHEQWVGYTKRAVKGSGSTTLFPRIKGSGSATPNEGVKGSEMSDKRVAVALPTKAITKASKPASNPSSDSAGDYIKVFTDHFGRPHNKGLEINNFDYGKICHWREQGISLVNFKDAMSRTAQVRPSNIWAYAEKILTDYANGTKQARVTQQTEAAFSMEALTQ